MALVITSWQTARWYRAARATIDSAPPFFFFFFVLFFCNKITKLFLCAYRDPEWLVVNYTEWDWVEVERKNKNSKNLSSWRNRRKQGRRIAERSAFGRFISGETLLSKLSTLSLPLNKSTFLSFFFFSVFFSRYVSTKIFSFLFFHAVDLFPREKKRLTCDREREREKERKNLSVPTKKLE